MDIALNATHGLNRRTSLGLLAVAAAMLAFGGTANAADPLRVGIASIGSDIIHYYASKTGIFDKHKVAVTLIDNTAANTASMVVSGQADIALYAGATPLLVAGQGKETSIIFVTGGGQIGGSVISDGKKVKTFEDLKTLSPCRIATFPAGTTAYGSAAYYKKNLKLNCELVPFNDPPSQLGALLSGRVDAIVGNYANFSNTISEGKVNVLLDSRDPVQRRKYGGEDYPESVMWGLTSVLKARADEVSRYIAALDESHKIVMAKSAKEVAEVLASVPVFKGRTQAQIEDDVNTGRVYLTTGSANGYISKAVWEKSLDRYALWGLTGFDPKSPNNSYEKRVDMSYYVKALGTPK